MFCHAKLCRLHRLSCNASSRGELALLSIFHLLKCPIFYCGAIYFPSKCIPALRVGSCLNFSTSTAADSHTLNIAYGLFHKDLCYFHSSSFFFLKTLVLSISCPDAGQEHFPHWRRFNQPRHYCPEMKQLFKSFPFTMLST